MGAKSKLKGNAGERALAKLLSSALGGSFVRSNGSGAFIGGKNWHRKSSLSENQVRNTKGDICPPDHMPHMVIECKFHSSIGYHLIFQRSALLDDWITQARSAADDGDFWVLGFKTNRVPWLVAFDAGLLHLFDVTNYAIYDGSVITNLETFVTVNKERILELGQKGSVLSESSRC